MTVAPDAMEYIGTVAEMPFEFLEWPVPKNLSIDMFPKGDKVLIGCW